MASAGRIALYTAGAAATGALGYVLYFDYMRRNSSDFRKSIRKSHQKVHAAAEARAQEEKARLKLELRKVVAELNNDELPTSPEQREVYFQEQVAEGEVLATQGPEQYAQAAMHFFRALRVYPQPVELLMIYQKVVPPPIFALVIEITQMPGLSPSSGPGAGGASADPLAALGGPSLRAPPPAEASLDDIDEALASNPQAAAAAAAVVAAAEEDDEDVEDEEEQQSPKADSAKSGASWEQVEGA